MSLLDNETTVIANHNAGKVDLIAVQEKNDARITMSIKNLSLREAESLINQLQQAVYAAIRNGHTTM